jgi:GAF domain-containing protein
VLVRGPRWAIDERFDLINLSLSTTERRVAAEPRELADHAYFRKVSIVASAHNMRIESSVQRRLLQSIVELGRAVFGAGACSIMSHDAQNRELLFEAVAGEGANTLVGRRLPATTGLAGWALASEEPISVADVSHDPRFARDVAESTGFVPSTITVFPLLADGRAIGVLNLLDQAASPSIGIAEMRVLGTLAEHAAAILALVLSARLAPDEESSDTLVGLRRAIDEADETDRRALLAIVAGLSELTR